MPTKTATAAKPRTNKPSDDSENPAPSQAVATRKDQVPANRIERLKADASKGVSRAAEDRIIPLIYVLQANSPQVKSRDPKYIKNAKDGDFWMRNSAVKEIIPGDDGFLFQSCAFLKVWIEWKPDRGGFVTVHPTRPADAKEQEVETDSGDTKTAWVRPNGNHVVETRQHFGHAKYGDGKKTVFEQYVLPFSSSGHTVSRTWMDLMNKFLIPGTSDPEPSWNRWWKLTTVNKTNAKNQSWAIIKVEAVDDGEVSDEEYEAGKALHEAVMAGAKQAMIPDEDGAASGGAGPEVM